MLPDQHRSDTVSRLFSEAPSRHPDHDEFKLHFPVPKDRTMRRIALIQIFFILAAPASCVGSIFLGEMAKPAHSGYESVHIDFNSPYATPSMILIGMFIIFFIGIFAMNIVHSIVMTRRYGWRAISDPIEAHRVAVREGVADVVTAGISTRPHDQQLPDRPPRRLRPITARIR